MKNFIKIVLGVIVGIGIINIVIFGFIMLLSLMSGGKNKPNVKSNSILTLNLDSEIKERNVENPLAFLENKNELQLGLYEILKNIDNAKQDKNIKGIYLNMSDIPNGQATIEAIRKKLIEFKTSGKFIYAYGLNYSERAYYLASVADKILVNPNGMIEFNGLGTRPFFLKNLIDKMGIEAQVFYAGKFKSATEPVRYTKMSEENKMQVKEYLNSFYSHYMNEISKTRGIQYKELDSLSRKGLVQDANDALKYRLADNLVYYDEFLKILKDKVGEKSEKDLHFIDMEAYDGTRDDDKKGGDKIAVVYAQGNISDGESDEDGIGGDKYARIFRKLRNDDKVKAVVVRVNSGGGSASASDIMWRELKLTKLKKPVVVSMGDVAASGGYYMSCMADRIFAEPNTLTGSIGVFGVIPNMQKFFENKMGITFDEVATGEMSNMYSTTKPFSEKEKNAMQGFINRIYDQFLQRVAEGRGKTKEQINEIAQGRVWSGNDALKNGLVDELGGLNDAIKFAAKKSNMNTYQVEAYPKAKNKIEAILEKISGNEEDKKQALIKSVLGDSYKYYMSIEEMKNYKGAQTRIPYNIEIY
jgi:protease-4